MSAETYLRLSEEQAAKWALTIDVEEFPREVTDAEAGYVADLLEDLWFKDMKHNRPHVIPRECGPETVKQFRAMCRAALKSRLLARRMAS